MGAESDYRNEWIEFHNISSQALDVGGWQLMDMGDQIHITFDSETSIQEEGYMLLERTDDNTVPGISADATYTGALSDDDEGLRLFNSNCELQDEALADSDWPAGSNNPDRSMERLPDLSWQTYNGDGANGIYGTPKAENSQPPLYYRPSASVSNDSSTTISASASSATNTTTVASVSRLLISEIQAGFEGGSERVRGIV